MNNKKKKKKIFQSIEANTQFNMILPIKHIVCATREGGETLLNLGRVQLESLHISKKITSPLMAAKNNEP